MKKRVMSMLMVLTILASMFTVPAFAAEEDASCAHTDLVWKVEGNQCWQACAAEGCDYTVNTGDHADSDDADYNCDHCGSHIHSLTAMAYDAEQHWTVCADTACTEGVTGEKTAHNWTADPNNTATKIVYTCECGITKNHSHVWNTTYSHDGYKHWYACTDSICSATNGEAMHYDYNGDNLCDVAACAATKSQTVLDSLTITGLTVPTEGAAVDFAVSVSESAYGAPTVEWKRMTKIDCSDAVVLNAYNTYSAGCMYDLEIWVPYSKNDPIATNINITVNGEKVPYYTTLAAYTNAKTTFEGINPVYRAHYDLKNGVPYMVISVLYGKVSGTHSCVFTTGWITSATQHYRKCTGCDAVADATKHVDANSNGLCDGCNYEMGTASTTTTPAAHTHSYGNDWVEDATNHWMQCTTCGNKTQTAKHADLNNTAKCDVCGYVMTAAAGHTHSYAGDWTETFAQHYKLCSCGAKTEIAAHADNNNSGLCDVCGYKMTASTTTSTVPATGDDNAVFLWLAAMIVSTLGLTGTIVLAKKRRED